ncbi:glycerophosphodiester phosphodiesterase [Nocardiopsis chromatogenes]|uniref:glycerophosphodiester phosphodiesterase n=1 Tax=Nocardiopsis chromatogenes TaxID=280239 RepID=UPI000349936C|nr:glycerophosphodiester phosphodiesterase [Nocardiopsis chromatogenes]
MTLAIALRGDTSRHRENTIPALRSAIDQGADVLALDLALTADGHAVLLREEAARGVWGLERPPGELSLAEIAAVTSDGGHRVPTLMEVVAEARHPRPAALLLRVDSAEAALAAEAVAADHSYTDRVWYTGAAEALHSVAARRPGAATVVSWDREGLPPAELWRGLRPRFVDLRADLVTRELVTEAHRRGHGVGAWTVNDFPEMARLIGMGVDAVTTERVEELAPLTAEGVQPPEPAAAGAGVGGPAAAGASAGAAVGSDGARPRGRHSA